MDRLVSWTYGTVGSRPGTGGSVAYELLFIPTGLSPSHWIPD